MKLSETTRVRPGRPPKFSPADAVTTALEIGVSQFTMASVAKRLSVTTPALYRCFPSRESLLGACFESIAEHITVPASSPHWRVFLEEVAEGWWSLFTRFPGLARMLTRHDPALCDLLPTGDALRGGITCHGFTSGQATFALSGVADLTISSVDRFQVALSGAPDRADPAGSAHRQWRQLVDFFLDHLASTAPDWPAWDSRYRNHLPGVCDQ